MERRQICGVVGAGLLATGVFAPVITVGPMNFSLYGSGLVDVIMIWAFAVLGAILALGKTYEGLWPVGFLSVGWIAFRLFYFTWNIGKFFGEARLEYAEGTEFAMSWGWIILFVGASLIIAAAAGKEGEG